jgi:hypothetical protein
MRYKKYKDYLWRLCSMEGERGKTIDHLLRDLDQAYKQRDDQTQRKIRRELRRLGHYRSVARVINLREVPEHFHRRLKMQAAAEGTTIAGLIIGVLTEYLERQGR